MDQNVLEEEDLDVDIEHGRFNEIRTNLVSSQNVLNHVWSKHLITNPLKTPLMEDRRESSRQSFDLQDTKFDKKIRKSSKPPRPPKGPVLSVDDQKLMREIAELAMRKRVRIERMKSLRRMRAVKSSSCSCTSVFAMVVTVIFFVFLIFQGFFTTSTSLNSDNSQAPTAVSVQLYNEFAPRDRINPSPTTSFRKRVSGLDNEENTRDSTI